MRSLQTACPRASTTWSMVVSDPVQGDAAPCDAQRARECQPGRLDEPRGTGARPAHGDRDAGVGVEPVELRRHVELDQVAVLEATASGDPVHRLVVDADAGGAGKAVVELGAGARTRALEHTLRNRVQLGRGDAGGNGEAHRAQRVGDHAPRRLEGSELLGGLDRHGRSIGTVVSTWRPAVMTRESQVRGRTCPRSARERVPESASVGFW